MYITEYLISNFNISYYQNIIAIPGIGLLRYIRLLKLSRVFLLLMGVVEKNFDNIVWELKLALKKVC